MDGIYSATLLVSLGAGAVAVVLGLSILFASIRGFAADVSVLIDNLRGVSLGATVLAVIALGISLGVHLGSGHRPGTLDAVGPAEFLAEHPSYVIAVVLPILAVLLLALARPLAARRSQAADR